MHTATGDSLDVISTVLGVVFPEDRQRCDDGRRALGVVELGHDVPCVAKRQSEHVGPSLNQLTKDLGRIQVLHDMRRPDELVAGEAAVGVLQTEQDVYSIA